MKIYYPLYYKDFTCIAGDCPDSCCKSWEIVIDEDTYSSYLKVNGSFGDRLRDSITEDEEGDRCFILKNNRCPFLNEDGLCDIHIQLGEKFTSEVCRLHPRFVEEYDGFTEISLSLSCPEAAELITDSVYSSDTYPVPAYKGDDEVLQLLIKSRKAMLSDKMSLSDCFACLAETAENDDFLINSVISDIKFMLSADDVKKYMRLLSDKCEILSSDWKTMLDRTMSYDISYAERDSFVKENEKQLLNVLRYYIYRYYLKAVNDLDVYTRALFIIYSVFSSAFIAFSNDLSVKDASRLYSKEIEHSTENIDIILSCLAEI